MLEFTSWFCFPWQTLHPYTSGTSCRKIPELCRIGWTHHLPSQSCLGLFWHSEIHQSHLYLSFSLTEVSLQDYLQYHAQSTVSFRTQNGSHLYNIMQTFPANLSTGIIYNLLYRHIIMIDSLHYAKSSIAWVFNRSFSLPYAPLSMLDGAHDTEKLLLKTQISGGLP